MQYINEILAHSCGLDQDEEIINYWISKLGFTKETFEESLEELSSINIEQLKQKSQANLDNNYVFEAVKQLIDNHAEVDIIPKKVADFGVELHFYPLFKPFIVQAIKMSRKDISLNISNEFSNNYIHEECLNNSLIELLKSLSRMSYRTLILELNVARISNILNGETPEERLSFFENQILNDEIYLKRLFEEYPVLLRLIHGSVDKWVKNTVNILLRLEKDYSLLKKEVFNNRSLGSIVNIEISMGDSHNGGQSVAIIKFAKGEKIVYKPRSLSIDNKFHNILSWYNQKKEVSKKLYELKTIDQGSYGWVEYVKRMDCVNDEEIKDYYHRLGSLLAFLYALNAVDFHAENIIAHGKHPVLIDLESLFHNLPDYESIESAQDKANKIIAKSVIRTGLLPVLMTFKENNQIRGFDISGIGDLDSQITPNKVRTIANNNSDEMRIERKHIKLEGLNNTPQINGQKLDVTEYSEYLKEGFTEAYSVILNSTEEFINLINDFQNVEIRHILRPTMRYSDLLQLSYHPDFLRKGIERDILFHKLWLDSYSADKLKITGKFEKNILLNNDIPYFYTKPISIDIYMQDVDSREIQLKNFFKRSSLNQVLEKISIFSLEDLSTQLQLIDLSLLAIKTRPAKTSKRLELPLKSKLYGQKEVLNEVINIAENLVTKAIWSDNNQEITWIGTRVVGIEENQWKVTPCGPDLYDGLGGIALFFTYLAKTTGIQKYKDISYKILKSNLSMIESLEQRDNNFNIGAFTGVTGYLYVISHFIKVWKDDSLIPYLNKGIAELNRFYLQDRTFDIISGSAGAIIVLVNIYKEFNNEEALNLAIKCGNHLMGNYVEPGNNGIGWTGVSSRPLSGFSHGNAGFVYALYLLYSVTGNNLFRQGVKKALNYERELFKNENWLDLRDINSDFDDPPAAAAWCHGAPGIILGRTLLKQLGYKDNQIDEEINRGIQITIDSGFGRDHSLCHGDLGNGEILRIVGSYTGNSDLFEVYDTVITRVMEEIKVGIWKTGMSKYFETPGLMVGMAGIGFGLLKSISEVPSITYLEL